MSNIIDYIKWRGDIDFSQSGFNEIDNLVLSRFSYFPFESLLKENEIISVKELANRFIKEDKSKMNILIENDNLLFPEMGISRRYGELQAMDYINKVEKEKERQFSAITIIMPDDTLFISYRGTDNTIIGWKEDLNMSFRSHIPSQISAKEYLEKIANKIPNKKIRIGGHSKGGNIGIYAASYVSEEIKNRIIQVYNNDGPGFCEEVSESKEYQEIISRVHTYIPQDSVIGRLMKHGEQYSIVESDEKGMMQHDLYSWQVLGTKFVYVEKLTNRSEFIDKTITDWLEKVEPQKREQVVDIVFELLYKTNEETIRGLRANWFESTKSVMGSYKNLDDESKQIIKQIVQSLLKSAKDNAFSGFHFLPEKKEVHIKSDEIILGK